MRKATPISQASLLRKSILQAAVQGKLVPQNANDEPASVLLERIKAEKAKLVKEGKLKKEKPLPPITEDEKPFALPNGWEWVRLGDVGDWGAGATPLRANSDYYVGGTINWLKTGELNDDIVYESEEKITEKALASCSLRMNQVGDILIAMYGATIGKLAIVGAPMTTNQACCGCTPFTGIYKRYLFYYLKAMKGYLVDQGEGGAQPNISRIKLRMSLFAFPPLAEQERIVAKVNELMHQCDQLEQAEQAALALDAHFFDTLPKSILQAAVQGKLVPQDEGDESASVLLERIKAEKAKLIKDGKLKKEKTLPPITEDEKPFALPHGWEWVRLGEIVSINPKNKLEDETEVAFLPMALISQDYHGEHQQEIRTWGQVKKGFTHFAEGDVLLAKITPCFENGKSCIAKNLKSGFGAGTTELHVLRCIEVFAPYLLLFLKNPMFLQDAAENMTGTAGQQRIPTEYLRNYVFALPPMEEQGRIVAKIEKTIQTIGK